MKYNELLWYLWNSFTYFRSNRMEGEDVWSDEELYSPDVLNTFDHQAVLSYESSDENVPLVNLVGMKKAQTTPKEQNDTNYSSDENLPLYYVRKHLQNKARGLTKEKLSS